MYTFLIEGVTYKFELDQFCFFKIHTNILFFFFSFRLYIAPCIFKLAKFLKSLCINFHFYKPEIIQILCVSRTCSIQLWYRAIM